MASKLAQVAVPRSNDLSNLIFAKFPFSDYFQLSTELLFPPKIYRQHESLKFFYVFTSELSTE